MTLRTAHNWPYVDQVGADELSATVENQISFLPCPYPHCYSHMGLNSNVMEHSYSDSSG
jgi:hypothetical protein